MQRNWFGIKWILFVSVLTALAGCGGDGNGGDSSKQVQRVVVTSTTYSNPGVNTVTIDSFVTNETDWKIRPGKYDVVEINEVHPYYACEPLLITVKTPDNTLQKWRTTLDTPYSTCSGSAEINFENIKAWVYSDDSGYYVISFGPHTRADNLPMTLKIEANLY